MRRERQDCNTPDLILHDYEGLYDDCILGLSGR